MRGFQFIHTTAQAATTELRKHGVKPEAVVTISIDTRTQQSASDHAPTSSDIVVEQESDYAIDTLIQQHKLP